jgi:hypothetical protein
VLLGFILEPEHNNSNYRVTLPMRALAERGHGLVRSEDIRVDTPLRQLLSCDLVHCYRRHDRITDLYELSCRGVAISFDNDDDISSSDTLSGKASLHGRRVNQRVSADYIAAARLADLVTTPSHRLAEKYRAAGAENVIVVGNHLASDLVGFGRRSAHDGIVVGWVAGAEHAADLPRLKLEDTLSRLLEAHADVRVLTVGVKLPLHSDRYEYIPRVPFARLFELTARIDIGIAPLADSAFNRARSDVKLKEYGAGGAAWLASDVGPYRELGEKQGGLLVEDGHWFESLDGLVRDRRARKRLSRRAMKWAKAQAIDRHVSLWESAFEHAFEHARNRMARTVRRPVRDGELHA